MKYKVVRMKYGKEVDTPHTIEVEADYFAPQGHSLVFYQEDDRGEPIPIRAFNDWDEVS